MSRGVNKAIIIGHLGQDPEVRYTQSGTAVANLSVATSYKRGDEDMTEWHRIVLFGKVAEIAGQYLKKGAQAYFEGRLATRKWQDQSGNDRYTTEIQAFEMQMLGEKPSGAGGARDTQAAANPAPQREMRDDDGPARPAPDADDGFDEIPF